MNGMEKLRQLRDALPTGESDKPVKVPAKQQIRDSEEQRELAEWHKSFGAEFIIKKNGVRKVLPCAAVHVAPRGNSDNRQRLDDGVRAVSKVEAARKIESIDADDDELLRLMEVER